MKYTIHRRDAENAEGRRELNVFLCVSSASSLASAVNLNFSNIQFKFHQRQRHRPFDRKERETL